MLFDDNTYTSMGSLCNDVPIVTFNGLSKSYIVPGFRIGWGIFSGPIDIMKDYIEAVNKMARARLSASHPGPICDQSRIGWSTRPYKRYDRSTYYPTRSDR